MFTSHERECTKDYRIPNTDFVIPKGHIVHVYFPKFTNSENNYVNPHSFDPDNFDPENFKNKFSFQGFGQGPRACPGIKCFFPLYSYVFISTPSPRLSVCDACSEDIPGQTDATLQGSSG